MAIEITSALQEPPRRNCRIARMIAISAITRPRKIASRYARTIVSKSRVRHSMVFITSRTTVGSAASPAIKNGLCAGAMNSDPGSQLSKPAALCRMRIHQRGACAPGSGRKARFDYAAVGHDVRDRLPGAEQIVGDDAPVAAPPERLGAHHGGRHLESELTQPREARGERGAHGVVGVVVETRVLPEGIGVLGDVALA